MSIQGSVNQLLGIGAVASNVMTKQAAENYAAKRGAEYNTSYQANVDAAKAGYTKSGAISNSAAAKEARAKVEATKPGEGSKAPWNKNVEAQLKADYDKRMGELTKTVNKGVAGLKEAKQKGKEATLNQFGDYKELAPQILDKMSAADRWRTLAKQRIIQRDAFNKFRESLDKKGV